MLEKATKKQKNGNGANQGFTAKLWAGARKPHSNMEPFDYKYVALGLIYIEYLSNNSETNRETLLKEDLSYQPDLQYTVVQTVFHPVEVLSVRWVV